MLISHWDALNPYFLYIFKQILKNQVLEVECFELYLYLCG